MPPLFFLSFFHFLKPNQLSVAPSFSSPLPCSLLMAPLSSLLLLFLSSHQKALSSQFLSLVSASASCGDRFPKTISTTSKKRGKEEEKKKNSREKRRRERDDGDGDGDEQQRRSSKEIDKEEEREKKRERERRSWCLSLLLLFHLFLLFRPGSLY